MPIISPEGIRTPSGDDPYALTPDLRRMAETINHIVSVPNATSRTGVVQALVAAGRPPSLTRPLYVDREDAPALGHLERTQDGTTWETIWAEVGRTWTAQAPGGDGLTTDYAEAANTASIDLAPGRYLVVAMIQVVVSSANITRIESLLFEGPKATATPLGQGQEAVSPVEVVGNITTRTIDFTRLVTITRTPGRLHARTRTVQVGGTLAHGRQSITAIRLPG